MQHAKSVGTGGRGIKSQANYLPKEKTGEKSRGGAKMESLKEKGILQGVRRRATNALTVRGGNTWGAQFARNKKHPIDW